MAATVEPTASDAAGNLPLLAGDHQDIGGRKQQEDRSVCIPDLNEVVAKRRPEVATDVRRAFFAVFDGFGGYQASDWLKDSFHVKLVMHESFADDPQKALQEVFASLDAELLEVMEGRDQQKNKGNPVLVRCGSCATACLVVGNEVYVGNVGDSSCVVYRRKGAPPPAAEMLTIDHKAGLQSERDRIAAAGGSTEQKTHDIPGFLCWKTRTVNVGPVRVQPGGLAVSRGFGAGHAKLEKFKGKAGCVICDPSMRSFTLDASVLCLVIASDGVWDNCKKLPMLSPTLKTSIKDAAVAKKAARVAAQSVVEFSLRNSPNAEAQDNTTAIVVVVGPEAAAGLA